jgi:hypothetical protein
LSFLVVAPGPAGTREQDMTTTIFTGDDPGPGPEGLPGDIYGTDASFESLGVSLPLTKALADQGISTAFPIQALTIADALAGRDVCGKAKTGSGKTLAFGLPLLQRVAASLDLGGEGHEDAVDLDGELPGRQENEGPGPGRRPRQPRGAPLARRVE